MRRREWLGAAAASLAAAPAQSAGAAQIRAEIVRLRLRHTWTTVMSSSDYRDNVHLSYRRDGVTALGEAAPIPRYKEDAVGAKSAIEGLRTWLAGADPWRFARIERELAQKLPGQYAARAAIDIALMDWVAQKLGVPLYRYLGLDPADAPLTTFSIGIDQPGVIRQKVREAGPFPILKIKVGLDVDEQTIAAVRSGFDVTKAGAIRRKPSAKSTGLRVRGWNWSSSPCRLRCWKRRAGCAAGFACL